MWREIHIRKLRAHISLKRTKNVVFEMIESNFSLSLLVACHDSKAESISQMKSMKVNYGEGERINAV